jgi:hypothetical protein
VVAEGGRRHKERLGYDLQDAERTHHKISVQVDEGTHQGREHQL